MKAPFNKAIRSLLLTDSLILVATAMLGPIYALFVEKIGGDLLDAGITFTVFSLTAGVVTLVSGNLSDKIREVKLIVALGFLVTGIGFISYMFVESMASLLAAQVVVGFGTAIRYPAFDALYSKHLDKNKRGMEWGAWESMFYFATAAGALIGSYTASTFGFNTLFAIMASLTLLGAILVYLLPKKLL